MLVASAMASDDDHMQPVNEVSLGELFRDFRKIFFDPCRSRQHFGIGGVCLLTHCDNCFVEAAEKWKSLKAVSETVDSTEFASLPAADVSCVGEDESRVSEGDIQPDVVRSAEDSELLPSPVSPDIVPEMDEVLLNKPCSEPSWSRKASLNRNLRQTVSCEEPPICSQVKVKRQISDSVTLRQLSSAYGSQEQSLSTLGRNEDEVDTSLSRDEEELAIVVTPSGTQQAPPLYSRVMTPDCVDVDDEDTMVLTLRPGNFQRPHPSNSSWRVDFPTVELPDNSATANIPSVVAGWQLTDENQFESVCIQSANDSFVTAADGLEEEENAPMDNRQAAPQPITYQELNTVITQLENRLIQGILIALLHENCSPEDVYMVAKVLVLSPTEAAASGRFYFSFHFHSISMLVIACLTHICKITVDRSVKCPNVYSFCTLPLQVELNV